ncbi:hypothetical protein RUM44_011890 [Polyplax serrata]|uniref:WD repeat-containing and planar cell polarity effector protein fritz n=1 Tax=Polyplax serrata TaxID=468196 RepID=A0ABR1BBN3_POLSC
MYSLFCEAKFWTLKNEIQIRNTDFGACRYYDKKEVDDCPYLEGKKSYHHQRGTSFILKNKRPLKLKNCLKELEQQLSVNKIVYSDWKNDSTLTIVLNTGLVIFIGVNINTSDIYKVNFDRFLIGKLHSENVCDVLATESHMLISYNENQITVINYTKSPSQLSIPQKLAKLEPKVQLVDLCGPTGRRLERRLSANKSGDLILTWWHSTRNEVYPWSPLVKDEDRANIHIYSLDGLKLDLMCFYRTEYDLIRVEFSQLKPCLIWLIEQKVSKKGEVVIEYTLHEIMKKTLKKISVTSIPLQTQICCHSVSPDEEKLVLGCIDGSLVVFDEPKGVTRLVRTAFIPNLVSWHPDGALIIIANERSQFQFFDFGLSCLRAQLLSEDEAPSNILDLAAYFKSQPTLLHMKWNKKSAALECTERYVPNDGHLFLIFDNGPLGILKLIGGGGLLNDVQNCGLTPDAIIRQYLLWDQSDKALNLLLNLNWNTNGSGCLAGLFHIANHVFRQIFTPERVALLEIALGSFYSPIRPLTRTIENDFGNQVHDLTRRFFYHLLRHRLYEKAYCLAIDLGNSDLFVDLYHCAKLLKDDEMMLACQTKFEEFSCASETSSHSCQSHSSCSCSQSSSDSEDNEDAILPPLPQVSVKKAKASRVPPLPDLNRQNKLRDCFESQTAITSFNEFHPSLVSHASKFVDHDPSSPSPHMMTREFPHSYEIRTSFTEERPSTNNFTPIEPVRQKFTDYGPPKAPNVFQARNGSCNSLTNVTEKLELGIPFRQTESLTKNYLQTRPNTIGPLQLKPPMPARPNPIYIPNNPVGICNGLNMTTTDHFLGPPLGHRLMYNRDKPSIRTNPLTSSNYYLPVNYPPRTDTFAPPLKNYNNKSNLLLQRPLQFVPNAKAKLVPKLANSAHVKQKVKFSDTVTQIDISKISLEDDTQDLQQTKRNFKMQKPTGSTIRNSNHSSNHLQQPSQFTLDFTPQAEQAEEEENNGTIKVIHFGVV